MPPMPPVYIRPRTVLFAGLEHGLPSLRLIGPPAKVRGAGLPKIYHGPVVVYNGKRPPTINKVRAFGLTVAITQIIEILRDPEAQAPTLNPLSPNFGVSIRGDLGDVLGGLNLGDLAAGRINFMNQVLNDP